MKVYPRTIFLTTTGALWSVAVGLYRLCKPKSLKEFVVSVRHRVCCLLVNTLSSFPKLIVITTVIDLKTVLCSLEQFPPALNFDENHFKNVFTTLGQLT